MRKADDSLFSPILGGGGATWTPRPVSEKLTVEVTVEVTMEVTVEVTVEVT